MIVVSGWLPKGESSASSQVRPAHTGWHGPELQPGPSSLGLPPCDCFLFVFGRDQDLQGAARWASSPVHLPPPGSTAEPSPSGLPVLGVGPRWELSPQRLGPTKAD